MSALCFRALAHERMLCIEAATQGIKPEGLCNVNSQLSIYQRSNFVILVTYYYFHWQRLWPSAMIPQLGSSASFLGPSIKLKCENACSKIIYNFKKTLTDHSSKSKALPLGSLCMLRSQGKVPKTGFSTYKVC